MLILRFLFTKYFRFNYWFHQLRPMGYHALNVILHAIVCVLYHKMVCDFLKSTQFPNLNHAQQFWWKPSLIDQNKSQEFSLMSLMSTFLFAIHPIHTEAVTGVVGRAELLSSIFFILAILAYRRSSLPMKKSDTQNFLGWTPMVMFVLVPIFVGCAMLCKEQVMKIFHKI